MDIGDKPMPTDLQKVKLVICLLDYKKYIGDLLTGVKRDNTWRKMDPMPVKKY